MNRNGSKSILRLMDFPEFAINHELQWELQFIISEILGHHNQKSLHLKAKESSLKTFIINWFVKEADHIVKILHKYLTGRVELTVYWSKTFFIISLKENIVFVKLFETPYGSDMLDSFREFQCLRTDTFGFIRNFWHLHSG